MILETRHVTIRMPDNPVFGGLPGSDPLEDLALQDQILGYILTDPKITRDALAIFPTSLAMARRKARAGGFGQGALFCALDFQKHPCHPDDPPEIPLRLLPSFELARLLIDYYRTSLDFRFLLTGGVDLIYETARLWAAVQASETPLAIEPQAALNDRVRLNLRWTGVLWTLLANSGKQQDIAARLSLSAPEIQAFSRLAESLPAHTDVPANQPDFDRLNQLVFALQQLTQGSLQNGLEASFLAIVATQVAGLAIEDEELSLVPILPLDWQGYALHLTYRGTKFTLQVNGKDGHMVLTEGSAIPVLVNGLEYMLEDEFFFDVVPIRVDQP